MAHFTCAVPPLEEGTSCCGSDTGVDARLVFAESDFFEEEDDDPPKERPSGPLPMAPPPPPGPFPSLLPDLDPEAPPPPFFLFSFTDAWKNCQIIQRVLLCVYFLNFVSQKMPKQIYKVSQV